MHQPLVQNAFLFCFTEEETKKISQQLEEQFTHSLENKLSGAARHHKGLGFEGEATSSTVGPNSKENEVQSSEAQGKDETAPEDKESEAKSEKNDKTSEEKDNSKTATAPDSTSGEGHKPPEKVKMMQFVRSSS